MNDPNLRPGARHAVAHTAQADKRSALAPRGSLAALAIGAIGVVYGDIGTSPLYAIDQIFLGPAGVAATPDNVLGAISLAIWTITLIVAMKYALLVLRAENDGEGGVFALYGLLHKYKDQGARVLLWSLMLGAGLLLGDGMITPAISVLSAVEGLKVATPTFAPYVLPITVILLTGLFAMQVKGASGIGVIFGPLMMVWFGVIATLGAARCSAKFLEGGFVPLSVGVAAFLTMATWRWGRKATFAAYAARSTLTMAELVELHRSATTFLERNALIMAPNTLRHPTDHAPTLVGLLWERYGILPRNLILVEVTHPKVPYIRENRYHVTVFHRDKDRGSIIGVELRFGFMEEPNVERYLENMARHKEIDLPTHPRQWIVHVSHENLLPAKRMNLFKRLRFRLFLFLRLVSRPAYYAYHLGDEVQLSAEIMPVRVR